MVSACPGRIFNPITDVDWRGVFPIKIGGVMVASFEQEDTELGENSKTHRFKILVQCKGRTNGQALHHRKGGTVHKGWFEIRIGLKQQKGIASKWQSPQ